MHRNLARYFAFGLAVTILSATGSQSMSIHHNAVSVSQPANDGNDPGGGGNPDPPCDSSCVVG